MKMTKDITDIIRYAEDKCVIRANDDNLDIIKENIFNYINTENIANLLSEINKAGTYQFVNNLEGCSLYINADGTTSGVLRKTDSTKIHEWGKLEKVGINAGNMCKIAANQAMFAYIIVQLDEISQKLDLIMEGQHNDRIAKIEGAVKAYEYLEGRDSGIDNIILQLVTGIAELEKEMNQLSGKLNPNAKFKDNWFSSSKEKENIKIYNQFTEAVGWIFKGYQTLLKIDSKNDKMTGTEHLIEFLEKVKWEKLAELARGLPYEKSKIGYPEERWERINAEKPAIIKNLRNMIDFEKREVNEYVIEFKGEQLMEVLR
jgi:predicted transcriptional regulator